MMPILGETSLGCDKTTSSAAWSPVPWAVTEKYQNGMECGAKEHMLLLEERLTELLTEDGRDNVA